MYSFEIIPINNIDLNEFYSFENKTIFTTVPWIKFVEADQNAEPIIIKITKGNSFIGYFTALLIKKFGIRIIGSPFRGWSTCFMGFDLMSKKDIVSIVPYLKEFIFKEFKCHYMEIADRNIPLSDTSKLTCVTKLARTLEVDIDKTDEELFKVFKTDCRNFIRQFERKGAKIEVAIPDEKFASEYYDQLKDVFAKQGLVPTYSLKKVNQLLSKLKNTDMLLCLRVLDPDGISIATSIFLGYNKKFFFWGGASYRKYQYYRPNEYMIWYAIRYWRDRGAKIFDMVGEREYKRKFGSLRAEYPVIIIPKYMYLMKLRNVAEKVFYISIRLKSYLQFNK